MPGRCEIVPLERAEHAGVAVVVDVIRAFTTAAAAFAAGCERIVCVEHLDEARARRAADPDLLLMGEDRGDRPPGFDLGNSPADLDGCDLAGVTVVQRTSNGTRGLLWSHAPHVLAAAAVNASATARYVERHHPAAPVRLVCTGDMAEDRACAAFIADALEGRAPDAAALARAVAGAHDEHVAAWVRRRGDDDVASFRADVETCAAVDRYAFAMVAERDGTAVVLRPVPV